MNRALFASLAVLIAAAPLAASAADAKPAAKAAAAFKAPRNAWGQPDLEGAWTNATMTSQNRPAQYQGRAVMTPQEVAALENASANEVKAGNQSTDPNAPPPTEGGVGGYNRGWLDPGSTVMRVHGEPRTSLLTTPDGQVPGRKGQAAGPAPGEFQRQGGQTPATGGAFTVDRFGSAYIPGERDPGAASGQYDNPEQRPLGERCIISFGRNGGPPMFPNGFYNNNYRLVQGKDEVAIQIEMVHDVRHVRLNSKHRTDDVRPWFGDSIGWYEGDTLVVETTNIPQRQAYAGSWQNLKVTERFKRVAKDRMLYQFTIDDPTMWDKPWGGEYEFADLHGELHEYACHEGNYAMEGILAGARAEEAAAAGKRAAVSR